MNEGSNMNYQIVILLLAALFCCGCAKERAQAAADARAGITAAAAHADPAGQAILSGVDARLPAVADANSADWPPPAMTPAAIEVDPRQYISTAPAEPKRGWLKIIGIAGAIGLPLLYAIGRVAPMVPGLGPAVGGIANLAWSLLAHGDQKSEDAAKETVAKASGNLLPLAQAANAHQEIIAALKVLAS